MYNTSDIVKATKCCIYKKCNECPYKCEKDSDGFCEYVLKDDIVSLIECEIIPRILCKDEIFDADIVWYESSQYDNGYGIVSHGSSESCAKIERIGQKGFAFEDINYYGVDCVWRCWSKKPTDEQLKNTPWKKDNGLF